MATLPEGITQEQLDRYAYLSKGLSALENEKELLGNHIKQAYSEAGLTGKRTLTYPSPKFGTVIVTLGEQRRLSKEALEELEKAFSWEEFPKYWKTALDIKSIPAIHVDPYREITTTLKVDVEKDEVLASPKRAQA